MVTQAQEVQKTTYPPETCGAIASRAVLCFFKHSTLKEVFHAISTRNWDSIEYVYIIDRNSRLIGIVNLANFKKTDSTTTLEKIMISPITTIGPYADQEKAVLLAVRDDSNAVAVVDKQGTFVGAITAKSLIDVMHKEHLEDALLASGIRGKGSHILQLASSRYRDIIKSRAPWLFFGTAVGLGLGYISSFFEATLQNSIALAYFVPVVAYIADSVGTQSEAITVRALAILNIKPRIYLLRELIIGIFLGLLLGVLGGIGAIIISNSQEIGLVVGLSLFTATTIASVLASLIPIVFKSLGKDPALGSGPLATAMQDVLSVVIYFLFAVIIIGS